MLVITSEGFRIMGDSAVPVEPEFTPDNNEKVVQTARNLELDLHKAIKQADSAHKISSSGTRLNSLCKLYLGLAKSPNVKQYKLDELASSMAELYKEDFPAVNDSFLKKITARKRVEKPELAKLLIHTAFFQPPILGLNLGAPTLINRYIKEEIKRNPDAKGIEILK